MRSPAIRRDKIIQILKNNKFHTIEEISNEINISYQTLHRDLDLLESAGHIKKVYGGVEFLGKPVVLEYEKRVNLNIDLKKEIALESVKLVEDGDHIFLDASSTSYYFGHVLINSKIENLTIVTNSVQIISLFAEIDSRIKIISTGGSFYRELNAFLGDFVVKFISNIRLDKIFISGAGFSLEGGLTTTNDFLLGILRKALNIADKKICLIDSSKHKKKYLLKVCDLQDFDTVITNTGIADVEVEKIRKAGVNLVQSGAKVSR